MDRRDYEAEYRRAQRRSRNELRIPRCRGPRRRARFEADDCQWLGYYLRSTFRRWTPMRREIVADIRATVAGGGYLAIAATRGEGKSSVVAGMATRLILTGDLDFCLVVGSTGPQAERLLRNICHSLETEPRLLEDYPEVVYPLWALAGSPQNANTQHVDGHYLRAQWAGPIRILPDVPGSRAAGSVLAAVGIDAALRGFNVRDRRPQLVIVDDPDTRESSRSAEQTAKRLEIIETDIAGLGSSARPAAVVALCNCPSRISVGFTLTDRAQRPAWRGKRYPLVKTWPDRVDLWEEYVARRARELGAGYGVARETDDWYLSNRRAMHAGAELGNDARYRSALADDGRPYEASALQAVYNAVADRGWPYVLGELQCDPQEEADRVDDQLATSTILSRAVGGARQAIPDGTARITIGVDVGKYYLHWVAVAWQRDATGQVVDYGAHQVVGVAVESDQGIEIAIADALQSWGRQYVLGPIGDRPADRVAVDLGYKPDGVVAGIRGLGTARVVGCKGTGDDLTPAGERAIVRDTTRRVRVGDYWQLGSSRRYGGAWLLIDSDHWKHWVRDRLATAPGQPGALTLFAEEGASHQAFAEHITNETYDAVRGKWVSRRRNHWADALYYAAAAASVDGIRLFAAQAAQVSWAAQREAKRDQRGQ